MTDAAKLNASQRIQDCMGRLRATPDFAPLLDRVPLDTSRPTEDQLSTEDFASAAEITAIGRVFPAVQACRKLLLDNMATQAPRVVEALIDTLTLVDQQLLAVSRGEINWGGYTRSVKAAVLKLNEKLAIESANPTRSSEPDETANQAALEYEQAWRAFYAHQLRPACEAFGD